MDAPVYLDHNATTPPRAEVVSAVSAALLETGNASSVHGFGRDRRKQVEVARSAVADLVGAQAQDVIFTSGGTEANNLALSGAGLRRVIVSAIEHVSVLQAVDSAEQVPVNRDGAVDLDGLAARLQGAAEPVLLSVMLANNETGVIQPVAEIAAIARAHGALLHCDAVQAAGRLPIDMGAMGVSMMTLSAHKIGGPQGVGALVLCPGTELAPVLRGGGQERGRRAGTENVAGIIGFGIAASLAWEDGDAIAASASLRDALEARLPDVIPEARIFGAAVLRLGNTSCFAIPGIVSETQVMALDLAGIAVSAGSACSSGKVRESHVLRAMGADPALAGCAIRVSFGPGNTEADVGRLLDALRDLRGRMESRKPAA